MLADTTTIQYSPDCIRKKTNWSKASANYRFDHPKFRPNTVLEDMHTHSPKLKALLENIKRLDHRDQTKFGHTFKHFIFSDLKSAPYGAKMIASALIADGMHLGYSAKPLYDFSILQDDKSDDDDDDDDGNSTKGKNPAWGPIELDDDGVLRETQSDNFYLLASTSVYDKPISVKMKKQILSKFNQRPENVYGEMARIIVMDSGFKEGIDLFDVKYVHIFEPPVNNADQKQVIGRGTRTCGQRGLEFDPKRGWPLHVFIYDLSIPEEYRNSFLGASSTFELYMKALNVDARMIQFGKEVERLTVFGSVDYELNKKIHHFAIEPDDDEIFGGETGHSYETNQLVKSLASAQMSNGGRRTKRERMRDPSPPLTQKRIEEIHNLRNRIRFVDTRKYKQNGYTRKKGDMYMYVKNPNPFDALRFDSSSRRSRSRSRSRSKSLIHSLSPSPSPSPATIEIQMPLFEGIPNHDSMRQYIHDHYKQFTWDDIKMENLCGPPAKGGAKPELIKYTPTQDFIKHYFTPQCPVKGMLLWHSVGTGKTCSAIASASSSFESAGYTILWVTRTTLKNDIWKNMFSQVCNESIRKKIARGHIESFPEDISAQMKLLGPSWRIRPISYKQFSNLVSRQNEYYKRLVKENGEEDPLRKTLLIIDEAHKLYGGGDLSSIERPDMDALKEALMRSYAISGENSARLLLMTATPITENPIEIVQLVNLCKPANQQIPSTFDAFADEYLDDTGVFTQAGEHKYLDDIAGHISYLNREKDARQFSQPIVQTVMVPIVSSSRHIDLYDKHALRETMTKGLREMKRELERRESNIDAELKDINLTRFLHLMKICEDADLAITKKDCTRIVKSNIQQLVKEAKEYVATVKAQHKDLQKEYAFLHKEKGNRLNRMNADIERHPEDYKQFVDSVFYMIKTMCSSKIRTNEDIQAKLARDHHIETIDRRIAECNQQMRNIEIEMNTTMDAYKIRVENIRKTLASDSQLTHMEQNILKQILTDDRKTFAKKRRDYTKKKKMAIDSVAEEIKEMEKSRKDRAGYIQKTLKKRLAIEKKEKKKIENMRKKMHSTMRKEGKLLANFNDRVISELQEKYEDKIEIDLLEAGEDRLLKEEEDKIKALEKQETALLKAREKQEKAKEKAIEKANVKEQRAKEKAKEKEDKARDNAIKKEHEKQHKAEQKELEKQHKAEQKELDKQLKAKEKEIEKQQKELEKQRKALEKKKA